MSDEWIKIFDEEHNPIGVAPRDEVHSKGYWHDTFHYWLVTEEEDSVYIYFQIRSNKKADYPGLLDITAAGHLLSHETIENGIREVREEIGIDVVIDDLDFLGVIDYSVNSEEFIDNEFAHTFLHRNPPQFEDFILQPDEVSGIVKTKFDAFQAFCYQSREELVVDGFEIDEKGVKTEVDRIVTRNHFVPHDEVYFEAIASRINNLLKGPGSLK